MRALPVPTRGSGPVDCCGGHLKGCLFGRQHTWATWYEDGRIQRTRLTFRCWTCQGVCTAEEGEPEVMAEGLGAGDGAAGRTPYGDLADAGSAHLMDSLGQHEPTTEENHGYRVGLLDAYREAWEKAAGRFYPIGE